MMESNNDEPDIDVSLEENEENYSLKIRHGSDEVASKNISENEISEYSELIEDIMSKEIRDSEYLLCEDHEDGKKIRELGEPDAYCIFEEDAFVNPKDYL